jgi:mannitol/fructose-specific phosphotransferase system IIA component (Ntr-type)
MNMTSEQSPLALARLISVQTVRARATVRSWEDAVDSLGTLLVAAGKVAPSYIPAMKRVLKEMGPYAVLAPGIVLLHARPEDGVLEACLALMTLVEPVAFGHSENDPVDLVFALGAVDKEAHLGALRQLAEMLGDAAVLKRLRAAGTDSELAEVFASMS